MGKPVFNLRVYGLLFNDKDEVLVSEQFYLNVQLIKFPGGGVHFGEGLLDALKREFYEEMELEIEVEDHFYTTDFFVPSAFHKDNQVISVYYTVKPKNKDLLENITDFKSPDGEILHWRKIAQLEEDDFPLPIEKVVCRLLKERKK